MSTSDPIAALRANVLGAVDDYGRLKFLGGLAEQLAEFRNLGPRFTIDDKGMVFLNAMLNEFFSASPEKGVFQSVLFKVNGFVDQESRVGGRVWGQVRSHLLEIGRQRGWSDAETLWNDWTPDQRKQFIDMIRTDSGEKGGLAVVAPPMASQDLHHEFDALSGVDSRSRSVAPSSTAAASGSRARRGPQAICENGHELETGQSRCPTCGARLKMQWMKSSSDLTSARVARSSTAAASGSRATKGPQAICENGHELETGQSRCPTCGARLKMQWMKSSSE